MLPQYLGEHRTTVAALSLDDIYLTHADQGQLAQRYPHNKLLHGRGLPGTHDMALGTSALERLRAINSSEREVELPTYDKSRFGGEGDRTDEVVRVSKQVDVVVFEGWMTGFEPLESSQLESTHREARDDGEAFASRLKLGYTPPFCAEQDAKVLQELNDLLRPYHDALWRHIDAFVQLAPQSLNFVWQWRLEQEHNMKRQNGGKGMSDEQVKQFIARYMPAYELFMGGIDSDNAPWKGRGLRLTVGPTREILDTATF